MKTLQSQLSCCLKRIPHNFIAEHSEFESDHYYERDDKEGNDHFLFTMSQFKAMKEQGITIQSDLLGLTEQPEVIKVKGVLLKISNRELEIKEIAFKKYWSEFKRSFMPKRIPE
jgi:hypothetical protein